MTPSAPGRQEPNHVIPQQDSSVDRHSEAHGDPALFGFSTEVRERNPSGEPDNMDGDLERRASDVEAGDDHGFRHWCRVCLCWHDFSSRCLKASIRFALLNLLASLWSGYFGLATRGPLAFFFIWSSGFFGSICIAQGVNVWRSRQNAVRS